MTRLKYPYTTYQKSNITFQKHKGCTRDCQLLYDHHHDQHFSYTCGTVILEANTYTTEYTTDPYYWEKEYQRRREITELKQIIRTLKENRIRKITLNIENRTITITQKITEDQEYLTNRSLRDTQFELIRNEDYYIIQKEKTIGGKKQWPIQ